MPSAWAPPDDDVFVCITELMGSAGTCLYGRRVYETLAMWETDAPQADRSDLTADYARAWQAADRVVYSSTLAAPLTSKTARAPPQRIADVRRDAHLDHGDLPPAAGPGADRAP